MADTTIYEIAEEAGCSAATVSRVINAYPYVKKDTREKVLKIIREKGFVPNETARSLVSRSSHLIGILLSDVRTTQHTDGIYYIEKELSKEGYLSIICNTGSNPSSISEYIKILTKRNVEAIILMGSIYQSEEVRRSLPDIPVVLCNGSLEGGNIYSIITDESEGVKKAVDFLFETGALHPAFVYDRETPSNLNKKDGYLRSLSSHGVESRILKVSSDIIEMKKELKSFLLENTAVDSIVFSEDFLALLSLPLLSSLGLNVPRDIEIIGINNSRYSLLGDITTIDNRLYETSLTAVRTVLSLLKGEEANRKIQLFTELVKRGSTREAEE